MDSDMDSRCRLVHRNSRPSSLFVTDHPINGDQNVIVHQHQPSVRPSAHHSISVSGSSGILRAATGEIRENTSTRYEEDRPEHVFASLIENGIARQQNLEYLCTNEVPDDKSLRTLTLLATSKDFTLVPSPPLRGPVNITKDDILLQEPIQSRLVEHDLSRNYNIDPNGVKHSDPKSLLARLVFRFGIPVHPPEYRVEIPRLTADVVLNVINNFQNLKKLEIVDHDLTDIVDHVCDILAHFSCRLTHLKVMTHSVEYHVSNAPLFLSDTWTKLSRALNSHGSNLRHLTIYDPLHRAPAMTELANLANLEELYYTFNVDTFVELFAHIEQFPMLRKFGCLNGTNSIDIKRIDTAVISSTIRKATKIASKLEVFIFPDFGLTLSLMNCVRFYANSSFVHLHALSLTDSSDLYSTSFNFRSLLGALIDLRNLTKLRIKYSPQMMEIWLDDTYEEKSPVLNHISSLHLDAAVCPHEEIRFIGLIFPKMNTLTVTGYYKDCYFLGEFYDNHQHEFCDHHDPELLSCTKRLISVIRLYKMDRFEKLRNVKLYRFPCVHSNERSDTLQRCADWKLFPVVFTEEHEFEDRRLDRFVGY